MSRNGITRLWLPTLGMLLWFAMSARSHVGDRVYPVTYLSDEMLSEIQLDDGSVDEWYELVGEPAMTLLDFTEAWGEKGTGSVRSRLPHLAGLARRPGPALRRLRGQ